MDVHFTFHDVAFVDLANPTVTITASVSALASPIPHAVGEEVVDFADTAALSIVLPPGKAGAWRWAQFCHKGVTVHAPARAYLWLLG